MKFGTHSASMIDSLGRPVKRLEDDRLITGHGRYVDDINPEGTLVGYMMRSQIASGTITELDVTDARDMPGVHLVLTADDITGLGGLKCEFDLTKFDKLGDNFYPEMPLLVKDQVRHIGDAVAFIVADDLNTARDAAEAIMIDYDNTDCCSSIENAVSDGAAPVWSRKPDNIAFVLEHGDHEAWLAAKRKAERIVELTVNNNKLVANYLEPRACIAEYDSASGRYTLTAGTQGGHMIRDALAAHVFNIDNAMIRVVTPDVGGGFGVKAAPYREYPLCMLAARLLNRPVKWVCERGEHFIADNHGRSNLTTMQLALDADNRITGLNVELLADMGAYLNFFAPDVPWVGSTMSTGVYDIPVCAVTVKGVYTHTLPVDAYRGAGRPEATFAIERLMDYAACELGLSPIELRQKNFIKPDQMPYTTPLGRTFDSGDFAATLNKAMVIADWDGFGERAKAASTNGKLRGIGVSSYIEACAFVSEETVELEFDDDGGFTLLIGTQSNGQGHETAYAQFIADQLNVDIAMIRTIQGDTDKVKTGGGTGGSRSITIGGIASQAAAKAMATNIKRFAADYMDVDMADIEIADNMVGIVGSNYQMSLPELAAKMPADLRISVSNYKNTVPNYPNGTHICEVEIDQDTATVEIINYVIVDDYGYTVNPLLLEGQVIGGVVQGIGQALYENTVYDEDGQLLTGSFLDYTMPRAENVPDFHFETMNIPCKTNPIGIKGAGEAGTIGATPAVMNAVIDALKRSYGITTLDLPATPYNIWQRINNA